MPDRLQVQIRQYLQAGHLDGEACHGFSSGIPAGTKLARFRVTTIMLWTRAVSTGRMRLAKLGST